MSPVVLVRRGDLHVSDQRQTLEQLGIEIGTSGRGFIRRFVSIEGRATNQHPVQAAAPVGACDAAARLRAKATLAFFLPARAAKRIPNS